MQMAHQNPPTEGIAGIFAGRPPWNGDVPR